MSKSKIVEIGHGIKEVRRKSVWALTERSPRCVEDLSFTSRDAEGRLCWWDVTPPKTGYYHVHEMLGRAYAFEVLDLMHVPGADYPKNILAYIANGMATWTPEGVERAAEPIRAGFFGVIGEFVATGDADR